MSAPKVWWLSELDHLTVESEAGELDTLSTDLWWGSKGDAEMWAPQLLVPQAPRDELREEIADTVAYLVEDMREVDIADAVLDVLTDRGLVASPETGEGPTLR